MNIEVIEKADSQFIADYEALTTEKEKLEFIANFIEGYEIVGWNIVVKNYVRPQLSRTSSIVLPSIAVEKDKYINQIGLVIGMGDECFKGTKFFTEDPKCKVGDWVHFRTVGDNITYKGISLRTMYDECIRAIVKDPSLITV